MNIYEFLMRFIRPRTVDDVMAPMFKTIRGLDEVAQQQERQSLAEEEKARKARAAAINAREERDRAAELSANFSVLVGAAD